MAFMNALQSQMGSRVPQQGMQGPPQMPQGPSQQMNPQMMPQQPPGQPGMINGGYTGRGVMNSQMGQGGGMGPSPQMIQQMMMRRRMMGQPGQMNQQGPPIQGQ